MKIGITGYGSSGRRYHALLEGIAQDVVRVADPSPRLADELSARAPHVSTTGDYRDLPRDPSLDALVITAPCEGRAELVAQALEYGKHVLVDPPLSLAVHEAEALADLAANRDRTLLVAHPWLYDTELERMRGLLIDRSIGRIRLLFSRRAGRAGDADSTWAQASHDVALFAHLLDDEPEWVNASEGPEGLLLTLGHARGLLGQIQVDPAEEKPTSQVTALTARTRLVLHSGHDGEDDPLGALCHHFVRCAEDDDVRRTDPHAEVDVVRVLAAAQSSLRAGERAELMPLSNG